MRPGTNPIHDPEGATLLADVVAVLQELGVDGGTALEGGHFADQRMHHRVKQGIRDARRAGALAPFREALNECKALALAEFREGGAAS
ncbi:MAG: hypothetical protein M3R38_02400 [Actinomycetota bacterium]|nr:hypothetical protein [Actinomycetota bacterium]